MDSDNPQPSHYFTDYSPHHNTLVPNITDSSYGRRIVRRQKDIWVEDRSGASTDPFYRPVTIGTLPDDALLEIFHFYVGGLDDHFRYSDRWRTLVHVCQRWRYGIFGSPRRLNLHLVCKYGTPVNDMLIIWPELPIIVDDGGDPTVEEADNVVAALELTDRVTRISLHLHEVPSSTLERFVTVMQVPFPALTDLELWWDNWDDVAPVISDGFLGGSAPHLRSLWLNGIPFPALPKLLLSAIDLTHLSLRNIPYSSYISPEEMITCLSALTSLEGLALVFRSPTSRPSQLEASRPPRPSTRAVLPSLTCFQFQGVTEYLEDLVARIDVPLLKDIGITFFNQLVFDIFQFPTFLCRMTQFTVFDQADVVFHTLFISITLSSQEGIIYPTTLKLEISCSELDWQLSSLPQVCGSILSTLSNVEYLNICEDQDSPPDWQDDIEITQWLELLYPFIAVKNLHLSSEVAPRVAQALLQELAGQRLTEVLPTLENIYFDVVQPYGPVQEAMEHFLAARQLSSQSAAVHLWERMM